MPGYAGFIPYEKSSNFYAKGYSPITRIAFNQKELGQNRHRLATTGFNLNTSAHIDHTRNASEHKHGMTTLPKPHPCVNSDKWVT